MTPFEHRTFAALSERVLKLDAGAEDLSEQVRDLQELLKPSIDDDDRRLQLARARAAETRRRHTDEAYADVLPLIQRLVNKENMSLRQVAKHLNAKNVASPRGDKWTHSKVYRILQRAQEADHVDA